MAYLLIVVVVCVVGIGALLLRRRQPGGWRPAIDRFAKARRAISPESADDHARRQAAVAARRDQRRRTRVRPRG